MGIVAVGHGGFGSWGWPGYGLFLEYAAGLICLSQDWSERRAAEPRQAGMAQLVRIADRFRHG
jgi:hypothetical protein